MLNKHASAAVPICQVAVERGTQGGVRRSIAFREPWVIQLSCIKLPVPNGEEPHNVGHVGSHHCESVCRHVQAVHVRRASHRLRSIQRWGMPCIPMLFTTMLLLLFLLMLVVLRLSFLFLFVIGVYRIPFVCRQRRMGFPFYETLSVSNRKIRCLLLSCEVLFLCLV